RPFHLCIDGFCSRYVCMSDSRAQNAVNFTNSIRTDSTKQKQKLVAADQSTAHVSKLNVPTVPNAWTEEEVEQPKVSKELGNSTKMLPRLSKRDYTETNRQTQTDPTTKAK